jgi:hypothetical protein
MINYDNYFFMTFTEPMTGLEQVLDRVSYRNKFERDTKPKEIKAWVKEIGLKKLLKAMEIEWIPMYLVSLKSSILFEAQPEHVEIIEQFIETQPPGTLWLRPYKMVNEHLMKENAKRYEGIQRRRYAALVKEKTAIEAMYPGIAEQPLTT